MKRATGLLLTLAAVSGCVSTGGPFATSMTGGMGPGPMAMQQGPNATSCGHAASATLPRAVGPWGEPVTVASYNPGAGPHAGLPPPGAPGMMPPPGPGMMPPGVFAPHGHVHAQGALTNGPTPFPTQRTQVRFVGPKGAKVGWYVPGPVGSDGKPIMLSNQLDVPGRYNFLQGSIYRLKVTNIPGHAGLELYPTIEVVPANPKTDAFLAHNFVPVEFTEEDILQIVAGNYLTKVIYLPDAENQSPLAAGPAELVSTRLEPGVDPIAEAHRRGYILLVVRLGGINLEAANTPPMDHLGPYGTPRPHPGMGAAPAPAITPSSGVIPASHKEKAKDQTGTTGVTPVPHQKKGLLDTVFEKKAEN